ncbi:hypothetical protein QZH41_012949 [Actinostola sp. cb2023]|nr:hypothetical protein QZH41_012949 [Actinostola sp. cb2023]
MLCPLYRYFLVLLPFLRYIPFCTAVINNAKTKEGLFGLAKELYLKRCTKLELKHAIMRYRAHKCWALIGRTFKSCLDYFRNGVQENGIYTITDTSGDSYEVFCDLTSEPRSAWTLIMSQAFKNRNMAAFCNEQLTVSAPVQENTPNWEAYRLSLNRMQLLSKQSTHLRITTGFTVYGVDFRDYLRAKVASLDILSFTGAGVCKKVEYIDIRGQKGYAVTVPFWQPPGESIHTDSNTFVCQFNGRKDSVYSENNFGRQCGATANPKFRGTANDDSTTEYWFGGYL